MNDLLLLTLLAASILTSIILAARLRAASAPEKRRDAVSLSDRSSRSELRQARELLERLGEGVLVLDPNLRPGYANPAARRLLGLRSSGTPPRVPAAEVMQVAEQALASGAGEEALVETWFPKRLTLRVQGSPLAEGDGVLVVIQDVSDEVRTQKMRREFVAHASHELKSPVASLQALAEAVAQAVPDDPEAATRFVERLLAETERLGKLITDLLDLSRLEESGALPEETVNLGAVAKRELRPIEVTAHQNGVTLRADVEAQVLVRGDAGQLRLLVRNLLENAVQYTGAGGNVTLEVKRAGHDAVVRVADTGVGIPLEAQGRVFERFYRVDRARSRARGGTGLGLAIVKHVVELHGGRIDLQSELGQGSTFTASIPLLDEKGETDVTQEQARESA